jgi:anti-sigma factor RsiW
MFRYSRRLALSLSLLLVVSVAACRDAGDRDQLAQDTALNRDLQLANRDTAALPALTDVPATGTPTTTAPRTTAPARTTTAPRTTTTPARTAPRTTPGNVVSTTPATAERRTGMIPAGSTIGFSSATRVCTNTHSVGQTFQATVANTVTGSNGAAIPAGATATVEITELRRSNNVNEPVVVGLRVRSVSIGGRTNPISAPPGGANGETISTATGTRPAPKEA